MKLRIIAINVWLRSQDEKLFKLRQQKSGLMHDLLTGKVPVKVEEPELVDG
jgi:type I restriction enzyme S subunit